MTVKAPEIGEIPARERRGGRWKLGRDEGIRVRHL